ncbi:MAG: hypothetical protein NC252_05905 [Roseburia sp.]|nr:hypothetical protein [Roseburia sp.]
MIEIRSREVQELMGKVPPGILRIGIYVILVFLIIVFILSCCITYPDTIEVMATLRNTDCVIDIKNSKEGIARNGISGCVRQVVKGDTLAVITQKNKENLYEEIIVSPATGTAYPCDSFKEKDYVEAGTSFCFIADTVYLKMTARAFVTSDLKAKLHAGMKAETSVNGCCIEGEITYIAEYANIVNESYSILMEFSLPLEFGTYIIWNYQAKIKIIIGEESIFDIFANKLTDNI